jgi:hypothetical protein
VNIDINNSSNDGVLSSDSTSKTYSLNQLPYAELIEVNKNSDEIIESIQVCHSNLETIEIFSNSPYCFYRINDIKLSKKPVLQTFILTDVFPRDKKECNQSNSEAYFKSEEMRFYTSTKNPSMTLVLKKNGDFRVSIAGNDNSSCCLKNTYETFNYGKMDKTPSTNAPTTTNPTYNEFTLPYINSISVSASSELSVGDTVAVNYDVTLGSKSLSIMYVTFLNQTTGQTYLVDKCCGIKPSDSLTFSIPNTWIAGEYSLQAVQIRDNGSDQGIVEYYNFEATGGKKQTYNKPKGAAGGAGETHSLFTSDILFTIVSNSTFTLPSIESISISSESSVNTGDLISVNYSVNLGSRPLRLMYLTFRNNSTNDTALITNCCDIPSSGNFTFSIPDTWIAGEYSLQAVQIRDNGGSNEGIVEYYNFEATGGKKQTYNKPKGAAGGAGETHSLFTSDILFTLDS